MAVPEVSTPAEEANGRLLSPDDAIAPPRPQEEEEEEREPVTWIPDPPDGGWGWLVVLGAFLIHVIADGIVYSFGIMVVELLETFSEGRGLTSWIISTLVGLTLGAGPIASAVTNRFGCRATTMAGALIATIGCAMSFFATSIVYLMISVGLIGGLGFGLMYCPAIVIVTVYFDDKRALATGIAVCGAGIGTFIFAPLTTYLVSEYGWRGAFLIDAGLVLNCAVCGALFRPVPMKPVYETVEVELENVDGSVLALEQEQTDETLDQAANRLEEKLEPPSGGQKDPGVQSGESTPRRQTISESVSVRNSLLNVNHKGLLPKILIQNATKDRYALELESPEVEVELGPDGQARLFRSALDINDLPPGTRVGRATSILTTFPSSSGRATPHRRRHHHHHSHANRARGWSESQGVLNMPDVFYPGSTRNISKEYHSHRDIYRSLAKLHVSDAALHKGTAGKRLSVKGRRSPSPELANFEKPEEEDESDWWEDTKQVLREMAGLGLLKDPIFVVFTISNFLTSFGFNAPLVFLPDKAHEQFGLSKEMAGLTLSGFGIANTIARVIIGYFCDKQFPCRYGRDISANRFWTYTVSITFCGIITIFSFLCHDFVSLVAYSAVYGITLGAYVCLTSVILVDLLGIEKLTNAFGLLLLFQGIASLIGPPLAGYIVDSTGNYDAAFYFAGASIAVSGLLMVLIPFMEKRIRSESFIRRVRSQ